MHQIYLIIQSFLSKGTQTIKFIVKKGKSSCFFNCKANGKKDDIQYIFDLKSLNSTGTKSTATSL